MHADNIFAALPEALDGEVFEDIVSADRVRIERIVSRGQVTPASEWYDQQESEWVILLKGAARIMLETPAAGGNARGTREVGLAPGDYLNIPAHCRHRVSWTDPQQQTVWLAVFYR
ncbi:phosphoribosylaminoimidazole carboxylase [Microbulbifer sp. YPW1]|uniref:phosphoribosylaminoimidazole carboxylase n=1 Tax=Microbulbifer sp. YPW1 TaxID=2745199 RepID=UPI001597D4FD|nr:phosphoribosylaminoimidazole carboxylase [Microbulbifer sp. YPW1]QKX16498.1 phosphoribosylaminoimidazole carboxylase [Microbulbifer sp. YPW1]